MTTASYSQTAFSPDRLFADPPPKLSRKITLLSGQNLARGAVLGKISGGVGATDDDGVADPIRMYLREMASVPLLDREGEVAIATSLEDGERRLYRALVSNLYLLERLLTTL